ncbi:hypothetical protein YS40_051 [Thermus phage phiYS40]|uniref:hypothetical protein n=1 Tax=Thermus phage phiYS40 TaxID=407392 RepID=UPI0000E689A9|nr:hypothetical protein YS40_051 [Thermus phage phiYS40]ABJ91445.1 hypothetical protein YS40_051 [Thermus phage phiYS40]BAK53569.1 hypothetical protein YSP_051 [Thermus phage phiYS40]
MKYLTIASSGAEDFICISDSPVDQTTNNLPVNSKCIRLRTKASSIEGFCPPLGQKIPKENYVVYNESSNSIDYYEASANTNCSVGYTKKTIALYQKPKFRYFRALILYGWSMKNYSCCGWDTSVAPNRSKRGLVPFRYEVWYFEFDSIEDAYAWRNPKPYNLTPMHLSTESSISSTTNYQRGVGYASSADYSFLGSYLHGTYGLQNIDDENGTKTIFITTGGSTNSVHILSGNYTKVRMYEGDFYNYLYNQAYNSSGYQNIPLWPLRRQFTTSYNDYTDEEKESIETFSNLYIAGIEYVLPDRYFRQNPIYTGGGGYWVYHYSLTPSLEKLDSTNTIGTDIMGFADLEINWYFGSKTFFTKTDGVYFSGATSSCSFPFDPIFANIMQYYMSRTLYYNPSGASLYATKNSISGYTTSPPDSKPPVMFPIIVTMRGDIGGDRVRHAAIKLGISIVYAVQYGQNEDKQNLPSYQFPDVCPPNTIPNANWILNL